MMNIQYTIRNIPVSVDRVIRKRSKQSGLSFNQTVVDLLSLQTFGTTEIANDDNFNWLYNKNTLDDSFDEAIKGISQVDKKIWQ
jgi:ribosome biogenesis protein Nip4